MIVLMPASAVIFLPPKNDFSDGLVFSNASCSLTAFSTLLSTSRFLSHLAFPQWGACTKNKLVEIHFREVLISDQLSSSFFTTASAINVLILFQRSLTVT